MSEIKNGKLGLYGAEHSKCDRMMTLGFKGLNLRGDQQGRMQKLSLGVTGGHSLSYIGSSGTKPNCMTDS